MISARVWSRVRALSRGLPLRWQERSSCLSQRTQHTDFTLYCSVYTPANPPHLPQPWLPSHLVTPWALSSMVQQPGFGRALTHELLLSHLPLFYWKRWRTAIETGGNWGFLVAPPSTHCPFVPTMQRPAGQGTFALEGNQGTEMGLHGAKHHPGPPALSLTAPKKSTATPSSRSPILLSFLGSSLDNGRKFSH